MSRDVYRTLERHSFLAVVLLAIVMALAGTLDRGLWTPDEPREAEIGRETRCDRPTVVGLASMAAVLSFAACGALVWIGCGGGAPEPLAAAGASLREHYGILETVPGAPAQGATSCVWSWVATAVLAGGAGVFSLSGVLRARSSSTPSLARASVLSVLAAFLLWLGALKPFIDPIKGIGEGARDAMRGIDAGEPLLGLGLDETSRAVIPFYTGRFIRSVPTSAQAIAALRDGPSRHLVVMDNVERLIDPTLRAHLHPVSTSRLSASRVLNVYRYDHGT